MARAGCWQVPLALRLVRGAATGEGEVMRGWFVPPVVIPAALIVFFLAYGLFRAFR